jgi:periplasmic protein TonB
MTAVPPTPEYVPDGSPESRKRPYRPPIGIPIRQQRKLVGAIVSVLLHLLVVLLLVFPFFGSDLIAEMLGAGGPGPAGGGGGGSGGTGGGRVVTERIQYVVPPRPATAEPDPTRIQPPEVKPVEVPPEEKPPEPVPIEVPPPTAASVPVPEVADLTVDLPAADVASKTAGTGGGSGNDGSAGSGSGSGGGIGSGIGTGTGSGVGAGTGGGSGKVFPPTPSELFIPPIPVPDKVKGKTITIVFDVDSTGKVIDFELTPTRDAGYNRKLREILGATRFRPATDATGRPVRAKYNLDYTF